ncbi:hypothetical protein [Paenibacillus sp. GCM10027626]|uniref:hypothetical protein n=1 Tax=Paenibacillus sp. GCM10027626 TaxID=3273411 RepID=UPI0036453464
MKRKSWKKTGLWACTILMVAILPGMAIAANAEESAGAESMAAMVALKKQEPFAIKVVDAETGRGIPNVELMTTNKITFYTDSAGYVAFDEPGLMNQKVFFHMSSHGYDIPADFFGNRGQAVDVKPGGSVTLKMNRINIAQRLYRITGQGIYRDSVLLGLKPPIKEPLLNGQVMGSDSVQTIKYRNKLYWFWGDTDRVAYPLGNFRVTGATSKLPDKGGLDPDVGVNLDYFTNKDGFVKSLVPPLPDGAGIAWVFGLMTVKDDKGNERLLAPYSTHNPEPTTYGILIWNDKKEEFQHLVQFPDKDDWRHAGEGGQASYYEDNGKGYWVFTQHKYPNLRVESKMSAILDYTQYEAFTPLAPGTKYDGANTKLERDAEGKLVWGWKKDTPMISQDEEKELIQMGLIKQEDAKYYQLKDVDTGDEVRIWQSSVEWNEYRQRYLMIGQQGFGKTSLVGEIWVAEAPAPNGPWTTAKHIITHADYSFYNPAQHEYFSKDGGKIIYFEATYTNTFTKSIPTPRYNYNQMMYRLDLNDPKLGLPLASAVKSPQQEGGYERDSRIDVLRIGRYRNG